MSEHNAPPAKLKKLIYTDDKLYDNVKHPMSVSLMKVLRYNAKKAGFKPHYNQKNEVGIKFYRYTRCIRGQTAIFINEIEDIVKAQINPLRYTLYDYVTKAAMLTYMVTKNPIYDFANYDKKDFFGAGDGSFVFGGTKTMVRSREALIRAAQYPLSVAVMEIIVKAANQKTRKYNDLFPSVLKMHPATKAQSMRGERCVFSDILKFVKSEFNVSGLTFYDVVKKAFDIVYETTKDPNYAPRIKQ